MNYPTNPFTQAISQGRKQVGIWVSMASNVTAEVIASAGFDWAVVDMEHSPNSVPSVMSQLQVFAGYGTTALVRPYWNDTVLVKRVLDIGAQGLVFPMVQSVEEAEAAVAACRYPPRGVRGVAAATRATAFGRTTDYFQRVEEEMTIILQLETQAAMAQAEEIAAVDGVSGVFFGPADIAADMGHLGKPMAPEAWAAIRPVSKKIADKGVPVGTLVGDVGFAAELLNEEFTFVACGTDTGLLAKAADATVSKMRDLLG